jgi:hypothetical protein
MIYYWMKKERKEHGTKERSIPAINTCDKRNNPRQRKRYIFRIVITEVSTP